jgi:hypothetical protein
MRGSVITSVVGPEGDVGLDPHAAVSRETANTVRREMPRSRFVMVKASLAGWHTPLGR